MDLCPDHQIAILQHRALINIQCLENRVQVLEAQNKQLIDELQKLKRTYQNEHRMNEHQPQVMRHEKCRIELVFEFFQPSKKKYHFKVITCQVVTCSNWQCLSKVTITSTKHCIIYRMNPQNLLVYIFSLPSKTDRNRATL